jgi:L-asparaginase / beta-aspartyl-peptidase
MNYLLPFTLLLLVACQSHETAPPMPAETKKSIQPVIALHGGAGDLKSLDLSASQEKEYLHIMDSALAVGYALLTNGASALDAVESVVKIMEDSPLFNAGKGAVFSNKGVNELDAAIMNGRNKDCGAVTGITRIKNPISLARNIMDSSKHIFLSGVGAEEYAQENGFSFVDPSYFYTEKRWQQLLEAKKKDSIELDHSASSEKKMGTVGCVALDKKGNLAAATSTGGLTNKKYGRIGDSPVIGAGTYADNEGVAISCTGRGEDFIKLSFAHQVNALVKYQKKSVQQAVEDTFEELKVKKGRGGCVAITASGEYYLGFTTSGMFRGVIDRNGVASTAIYK